jgi:phospholipid-transporting ATPase
MTIPSCKSILISRGCSSIYMYFCNGPLWLALQKISWYLSHRTLLKYPQLGYGSGQRGEAYNQTLFWATMLDMLWQSLVIFYVPFFIYNVSDIDLYSLGCLWVIAVVVVVNVNLAMDILHWNWVAHVVVWGSVIATFLGQIIMDSLSFSDDLLSHYW